MRGVSLAIVAIRSNPFILVYFFYFNFSKGISTAEVARALIERAEDVTDDVVEMLVSITDFKGTWCTCTCR